MKILSDLWSLPVLFARMTPPLNVGESLRAAAQRLRASGSRSPRLDAELLLAHVLGCLRAELLRESGRALDAGEAAMFREPAGAP